MSEATIVEVAPRDGFQAVKGTIPAAIKIEAIRKLAVSGLKRIEIGSFVSPKALPQMADIEEIVAAVAELTSISSMVLVPNRRGAVRAVDANVRNLAFVVSVSENHNLSNVGRTVDQSIDELSSIVDSLGDAIGQLRVNLATSFDCPFSGPVAPADVLALARRVLLIAPACELALCDTTGRAFPHEVGALFRSAIREFGVDCALAFHAHDTYGFAIASILSAYDAGVRTFDAAAGGLGGCPFAPGASGNVATEDVVFALMRAGVDVGVSFEALLDASDFVAAIDPSASSGHMRIAPRVRMLDDMRTWTQGSVY